MAIALLLIIVTISYRQTIYAYPNGGGAYIVARDNLGELAAQIAGAALLTDYILTVAVSISSGVAQIASAFPALLPFRVEIALLVIFIMTVVNLRGVKESGTIFSIPTYFFLLAMFTTLAVGLYRYFSGTLDVVTGVEMAESVIEPLTLFLILRAFSSGCAALTGIEAISNGITAFKEPRSHNAAVTLQWMSGILITIFLSITFLAHQIQAVPSESETIISQLGRAIFGEGSAVFVFDWMAFDVFGGGTGVGSGFAGFVGDEHRVVDPLARDGKASVSHDLGFVLIDHQFEIGRVLQKS